MPLISCPSCRAELDIPADWLGESITCSDCQTEFVARASARPRSAPRPRLDDDEDDDDRPRRRRPPKKSSTGPTLLILGGLGLLVLLVCGGGIGWFVVSLTKSVTFKESDWREHSLFDGGATVQVPVTLTPDPILNPGFGVTAHKDRWEAAGIKDAAFAFGVIDCQANNPITLDEVYSEERDEIVKVVQGRVVNERTLTIQGCPAKEFEVAAGNATVVCRYVYLSERNRKRFFVIMAGGRNMTAADRAKFIESFRIKTRK